jgi:hypothetical protein
MEGAKCILARREIGEKIGRKRKDKMVILMRGLPASMKSLMKWNKILFSRLPGLGAATIGLIRQNLPVGLIGLAGCIEQELVEALGRWHCGVCCRERA